MIIAITPTPITWPSKALISSILRAFTIIQKMYIKNIPRKILKAAVPLIKRYSWKSTVATRNISIISEMVI
jgi:hypothetical protein